VHRDDLERPWRIDGLMSGIADILILRSYTSARGFRRQRDSQEHLSKDTLRGVGVLLMSNE